ncbi:MAG: hypothetical protein WBZ36_05175 [Candidatus Nitrosopolaris sp.]
MREKADMTASKFRNSAILESKSILVVLISLTALTMITAGSLHLVLADALHCDIQGWPSCYSIGYQDGLADLGTNCTSGHSDNFCAGWEAAASSGVHLQNSIPLAYATHGKHCLDGFNRKI